MTKTMIDQLVAESNSGLALTRSALLPNIHLSNDDIDAVQKYIVAHADHSAYHLLFALRRSAPDAYEGLPSETKAHVLGDALAHQSYLNDWGYLDPGGSHEGEAAQALLALGEDALPTLTPLLDDDSPVWLFGSEAATLSSSYQYRRKDFAYRYIALILGLPASFDADPAQRDQAIERLKTQLAGKNFSATE